MERGLFEQFERVIVDPEHRSREEESEEHSLARVDSANRVEDQNRATLNRQEEPEGRPERPANSYARRILNLLRKPREQWAQEDYAFAARVVREGRASVDEGRVSTVPEAPVPSRVTVRGANRNLARDEFDRRLWGLPSRPYLSSHS